MTETRDEHEEPKFGGTELHGHLTAVGDDLMHLQGLLDDACATLMDGFMGVSAQLRNLQIVKPANHAAIARAAEHLDATARALQFQDMSTQLIAHARQRLRYCAQRLAQEGGADAPADPEPAPSRPNPVSQSRMRRGSVEIF